jgi:diketogulonate reductase-like aldo/keto reductase
VTSAPFFAAADTNCAARCHARRNWTPSGKYKRRHRLFDALRVVKAALHEQRWGVGSLALGRESAPLYGARSMEQMPPLSRRRLLRALAATGAAALLRPQLASSQQARVLSRPIPSTGEELPVVGLGSWITFNVGNDTIARDACAQVMRAFFDSGGRLIDSSPMYGSSQKVIGYGLTKLNGPPSLFSADKVWISSGARGPEQIEASRRFWGVPRFDLLQVHNLLSWEEHLRTLFAMKAAGRLRYVGITTSEGRRHGEVERIMRAQPLDFVQVSYNILDREVEHHILPLARERGIGVIVNRPFREGELLRKLERHPLPGWAAEIDCASWAQIILKFIVSHPAVTCAIPATTRVDHVQENLAAATGLLPDEAMRRRMIAHVEKL